MVNGREERRKEKSFKFSVRLQLMSVALALDTS